MCLSPADRASWRILKKFAWLASALVYCILLLSGTAQAQSSSTSPFDGMSAIDIEVAAALLNPAADISGTSQSLDSPQTGASSVHFLQFDFVEVKGRPGHEGELPIPGEPQPGPGTAVAQLSGLAEAVQFRLVDESGALIELVDLQLPEGESLGFAYLGTLTVPSQPFRVAASGNDLDGLSFDVTWDRLFSPQMFEVRFDPELLMVEPGLAELGATVTNHGPTKTFAIDVVNNLGLDVSSNVLQLELAQGQSAPIVVSLDVPAISTGVLSITVTATVTSIDDPQASNHGNALARLERFERVFWNGFD
jgi:hypothetical protein